MTNKFSNCWITALGLFFLTIPIAFASNEKSTNDKITILTTKFKSRHVVQIESGDFRFKPWQIGPIHTHPAPCIGYIVKGSIIYQVEGRKPQLLRTGDAFYEPSGPRIMRFDNASATSDAIFIDFCPEQENEPFILFEKQPTEFIDRRALSTKIIDNTLIFDQVEGLELLLKANERIHLDNSNSLVAGYVVTGEVELQTEGTDTTLFQAGKNFYLEASHNQTVLINKSPKNPAKVITFKLSYSAPS